MPEFQMETTGAVVAPAIEGGIQTEFVLGKAAVEWRDLDDFTQGYITCMFWTNSGDTEDELTDAHDFDNLAGDTLRTILLDCAKFQEANAGDLDAAYSLLTDYTRARAGHDLWLTRNHHGAGYWDRDLGAIGEALTCAAELAGERDLYLGDDGAIYLT